VEIRQLQTFRTLARTLSFTQTAANLSYAQSSITAQIQALEVELGTPLLDRLGKRVVLTDAGRRFLSYVEKILALLDEARESINVGETISGTLVVSATETLCTYRIPPLLKEFRTRYPEVNLQFKPLRWLQLRSEVLNGALDIAFALDHLRPVNSLVITPLIYEPICLIAAAGHPLAEQAVVYPADLAGETILFTEQGCSYRTMFEQDLAEVGVYPRTQFEFMTVDAIKQCVIAGLGVSVLPEVVVATEVAAGTLVVLPWARRDFHLHTQMMIHKDKSESRTLKAFIDLAQMMLCGEEMPV